MTTKYVIATIPSFGPNANGPGGWFDVKVRPERLDHYRSLGDGYDGPGRRTTISTATPTARRSKATSRSRRSRGGRASSRRPGSCATARSSARIHPHLARLGLTKYWNLYVFRVPDAAAARGEQRSAVGDRRRGEAVRLRRAGRRPRGSRPRSRPRSDRRRPGREPARPVPARAAQDRVHVWRVDARPAGGPPSRRARLRERFGLATPDIRDAPPERFVRAAFQIILRRDPDPDGLRNYVTRARGQAAHARRCARRAPHVDGAAYRRAVPEHLAVAPPVAVATSCACCRGRARILDLGGTDQADEVGRARLDGLPVSRSSC